MDWRHMLGRLTTGHAAFTELKSLCVWNKTNGGMGTFCRSKHELVFVWKVGTAAHINTFGLGDTGRYRTNVWDYAGSSIGASRADELAMHPTVKPVALVADAIRDCSNRGDVVLDGFGGSGNTLIAAEKCGADPAANRDQRLIDLMFEVRIAYEQLQVSSAASLDERPRSAGSRASTSRGCCTWRHYTRHRRRDHG